MLDFALSASVEDRLWNSLPETTELAPVEDGDFFDEDHKTESHDARRRFRRVRVAGRAVMSQDGQHAGVYLHDVSPMGMGFVSPRQLLPQDLVTISCAESDALRVRIRRCRRIAAGCYACGTVFAKGPMSPAEYREFLHSLKS